MRKCNSSLVRLVLEEGLCKYRSVCLVMKSALRVGVYPASDELIIRRGAKLSKSGQGRRGYISISYTQYKVLMAQLGRALS